LLVKAKGKGKVAPVLTHHAMEVFQECTDNAIYILDGCELSH